MVDRLWVMWRDANDQRHVIGQLWRAGDGFAFAYHPQLPPDFHLLAEFPDHRDAANPYQSPYLFATFAERVPSPRRPDYRAMLDSWGVEHADDQLEVLARSGGIQATDWIELSEWRASGDDLRAPLLVRAAGTRYHEGADHAQVGDPVRLEREPENRSDPSATLLVLLHSNRKLGYVPRPYTGLVAALLDAGAAIDARVERKLGLPQSYGRWVVRLVRSG